MDIYITRSLAFKKKQIDNFGSLEKARGAWVDIILAENLIRWEQFYQPLSLFDLLCQKELISPAHIYDPDLKDRKSTVQSFYKFGYSKSTIMRWLKLWKEAEPEKFKEKDGKIIVHWTFYFNLVFKEKKEKSNDIDMSEIISFIVDKIDSPELFPKKMREAEDFEDQVFNVQEKDDKYVIKLFNHITREIMIQIEEETKLSSESFFILQLKKKDRIIDRLKAKVKHLQRQIK